MGREWRVWSESERRAVLSRLGSPGGHVRALVASCGGSVSSPLLAVAEGIEESVVEADLEGLEMGVEHARALWRMGSSCPVLSESELSALLSAEGLSEEEVASALPVALSVLGFVWVDASRRWVVLPRGLSRREAVGRFVAAWREGGVVLSRGACRGELTPGEECVARRVGG